MKHTTFSRSDATIRNANRDVSMSTQSSVRLGFGMLVLSVATPLALAFALGGCKQAKEHETATTAVPLPKAEVSAKPAPRTAIDVKGAYDAKVAAVRTPKDAPAIVDISEGAVGAGSFRVSLPATRGPSIGTATGALGKQTFTGFLEDGRLTGNLVPEGDSETKMWGIVDATVTSKDDDRVVSGTLRASSRDGRLVREASFKLTVEATPTAAASAAKHTP